VTQPFRHIQKHIENFSLFPPLIIYILSCSCGHGSFSIWMVDETLPKLFCLRSNLETGIWCRSISFFHCKYHTILWTLLLHGFVSCLYRGLLVPSCCWSVISEWYQIRCYTKQESFLDSNSVKRPRYFSLTRQVPLSSYKRKVVCVLQSKASHWISKQLLTRSQFTIRKPAKIGHGRCSHRFLHCVDKQKFYSGNCESWCTVITGLIIRPPGLRGLG